MIINKTFKFNIRLPKMKLIGIIKNSRLTIKGFKLVLDSDNNIIFYIKYYLNYFNKNIILNYHINFKHLRCACSSTG